MLFQGQEVGARTPFVFFADHEPELAARVKEGRFAFLSAFPSLATPEARACLADPAELATFLRCKLRRERNDVPTLTLMRDLLALRKQDPVLTNARRGSFDGETLGENALALRFFDERHGDRLLIVNLGPEAPLTPAPYPLLSPPPGRSWRRLFATDDPRYGGPGPREVVEQSGAILLPAESAYLLT
jgi:maltooligosyltrehalose trehalohydrolase